MRSLILVFILNLACAATAATAPAQMPAYTEPGPVPPAIARAKTIFVSNAGSDSGLFPAPFSGDQDRGYTEFYAALKSGGNFTLVTDPAQADLVLELRLTAPYGPSDANKQKGASDPLPMFRLMIYDGRTHFILWTITESVQVAYLQKTHDKNFDSALDAVLSQFLQLSGKSPAGGH
jgi:hypothetical protein